MDDRCDLGRILTIHAKFQADRSISRPVRHHFLFRGEGFKMAASWRHDCESPSTCGCDWSPTLMTHVMFEADWSMFRLVIEHFLCHGEAKWPHSVGRRFHALRLLRSVLITFDHDRRE